MYGIDLAWFEAIDKLDAIVAAVVHDERLVMDLSELATKSTVGAPFIDIKSSYDRDATGCRRL